MNKKIITTISFDDIDYPDGGCTTHLTGLFLIELKKRKKTNLADYPGLVRLNPAIPWKTRGNAATFVRIYTDSIDEANELFEIAKSLASEYCEGRRKSTKGPGIVMALGEVWRNPYLRTIYRKAINDVLVKDIVEKTLLKLKAKWFGNRGVIGATAALAALVPGDFYTYELIAYRRPEMWNTKRCLREETFLRVESKLPTCVFNNYDIIKRRVSAVPQGLDPVLAGFRGTCPEYLVCYKKALCEKPHFWVLYRTNQHTDLYNMPISKFRAYKSGRILGTVISRPHIIQGSHITIKINVNGKIVNALFFRETGPLKDVAKELDIGDRIEIIGSFRTFLSSEDPVFAVDKLHIIFVSNKTIIRNPRCPKCGTRMKSDGKEFRCPKCGFKLPKSKKIILEVNRTLKPLIITSEEGQWRHLTSPYLINLPRLERLPLNTNLLEVLSLGINPPVIDPHISCGDH